MTGQVYQISTGSYGGQPHLYVVVLEFSGNKDCIIVPAFSADGFKVNQVIQARLAAGNRIDQIAVLLDNAKHISFTSSHSGKEAYWLVSDADRIALNAVQAQRLVGTMDDAGIKAIAEGLLNFAPNTMRFSAAVLKKLRKLTE
jgi:hypothetical protein